MKPTSFLYYSIFHSQTSGKLTMVPTKLVGFTPYQTHKSPIVINPNRHGAESASTPAQEAEKTVWWDTGSEFDAHYS